jgi:putative membrane protein
MLDLVLAIGHHLLIFSLFGVLAVEFVVVRPGLTQPWVGRIAKIDIWYGLIAALIVAVGFGRAIFAAKGWHYYSHNLFFWLKLATFAVIGLLSVPPTLAFIRWRRTGQTPDPGEIAQVRRLIGTELVLFAALPAFAAAMARGYGELN